MRGSVIAIAAALALAGCGDSGSTGPIESVTGAPSGSVDAELLPAMILHLPDAPEGSNVGDDSHCGNQLGTEGESDAFLDLVVEAGGVIEGCFIQLEAPETFVYSLVLSFPSEQLAVRAMTPDAFAGVVRYFGLDCCNAEPVGAVAAADGPGDEALAASSPSDAAAVLGWRDGALVGAVSVLSLDGARGAAAEAERLAAVQHERMLHPVAVADDIDDDRLVGLEQAPFTAWWVGETFAPPGFPPIELSMSDYQHGMVDLDYRGIRVQVFDLANVPAGSEPEQMIGVTAELFDSPCTLIEPIDGPGTALVLGRFVPDKLLSPLPGGMQTGWGDLATGECADGEPNVWMATVDVDGLYIQVNPTLCYNCLLPPTPELPYRTAEGMRTVVAALTPFDH